MKGISLILFFYCVYYYYKFLVYILFQNINVITIISFQRSVEFLFWIVVRFLVLIEYQYYLSLKRNFAESNSDASFTRENYFIKKIRVVGWYKYSRWEIRSSYAGVFIYIFFILLLFAQQLFIRFNVDRLDINEFFFDVNKAIMDLDRTENYYEEEYDRE